MTQAHLVIGGTLLLFLVPALCDVLADPTRPYGYLAPDAFYYFTIGVNWVELGTPSFDQVHPTNGFHPLWQWLVAGLYAGLSGLGFSRFALAPVAVVLCLLILGAAIALLGAALTKDRRISPLFAVLPVGVWPLSISPHWWASSDEVTGALRVPLFGTLWNFANGLESALLLLIFAVASWLYVRRPVTTLPRALVLGVTLGALALARLDHAVFSLAIAGLPLAYHMAARDWRRVRLGSWTLLACLAILLMYLMYNRVVVGRFMPVSGAVKSTFPSVTPDNVQWLLSLPTLDPRKAMYALGRIGSVTFPAIVALCYFPFALRPRASGGEQGPQLREGHGRFSQLMLLTAAGILALTTYDVLFVVQWHIGEWYAPISVLFVSLFAVQVAERITQRWRAHRSLGWVLAVGLAAVQLVYFFELQRVLPWGKAYADFCLVQAPKVAAFYADSSARLLSRDDGVVAFGTGLPTTSGTRLALDAEAAAATTNGRFEGLLEQRGIDRITALHYHSARGFRVGERSRRVQRFARAILGGPSVRAFEVEYVDGSFGIVRPVSGRQR